jgi:Bacterial protein of unknown function (DUF899)
MDEFGQRVCYLRHGDQAFESYRSGGPGAAALAPTCPLLDMTVHGRQQTRPDAPPGWPRYFGISGEQFRPSDRPAAP